MWGCTENYTCAFYFHAKSTIKNTFGGFTVPKTVKYKIPVIHLIKGDEWIAQFIQKNRQNFRKIKGVDGVTFKILFSKSENERSHR